MPKIIHCADIHLDAPFTLTSAEMADLRRGEIRSAFTALIQYAKSVGTEIFLIAGDLFDDARITKDTAEMLRREFAGFPECRFFIAPGNHDFYHERSPFRILKWPPNVHVFTEETLTSFDLPDQNTRIYGYAFTSDTMTQNPFSHFTAPKDGRINLLVAHGDLDVPLSPYCPILRADIEASGFDYVALGHIHDASGIQKAGNTFYAYPGCLEGRGFDETGPKGAIAGTVESGSVSLKGLRFSRKRYEKITLDLTGISSPAEAYEKIARHSAEFHEDTALRVIITGVVSPDLLLDLAGLRAHLPRPYLLELKDQTLPILNFSRLDKDETLLGVYFRRLSPLFSSQDEEQRKRAALALNYGLCALTGKEIGLEVD